MTVPTDPSADEDTLPEPPMAGAGLFGETPAVASPIAAAAAPALSGPPQSYRVLARKYRPVSFDDMIGQEAMVRVLRRAFAIGRVAHAFMLTGTRGIGKTTTARIIARALACTGPDGRGGPTADPCGVCPNCVEILGDRHPDVVEMDAASRTGVDDVREIIEATRFRPMLARAKVFIIDEVHMLSRNAFNALLKTLEEPPAHVTFVFATTELRKVPVTVLSRCQRFDLRRVPQQVLADHYGRIAAREGVAIDPDALVLIARAADGSVRDGLSLLDQAIAQAPPDPSSVMAPAIDAASVADMLGLADRGAMFDLLDAVMGGRAADALGIASAAFSRGADPGLVLTDLLELVHGASRIKAIPALADDRTLPELDRVRGAALAARVGMPALARTWQMLLKGIGEVEHAPRREDAAEMVIVRLCFVADLPTPGDLVRRLAEGSASAGASPPAPQGRAGSAGDRPPPAPGASLPNPGAGLRHGNLAVADAPPEPADAPRAAMPADWRAIVALVAELGRDPMLHGHLRHAVHPVRVSPGIVEIRVAPRSPRDLAPRLAAVLTRATGTRWTVALSGEPGEPTLDEQADAHLQATRATAEAHPLVQEILRRFPGAVVGAIRDPALDDYGLPRVAAGPTGIVLGGEPDIPEFAPLDAERASDIMPPDPEDVSGPDPDLHDGSDTP